MDSIKDHSIKDAVSPGLLLGTRGESEKLPELGE